MSKSILKVTEGHCVVKVAGAGTETIGLKTDIKKANETADTTVHVDITGLTWTGETAGLITITRNSIRVATIQAAVPGQLHLDGNGMIPDATESSSDIVVTITGQAECWLRLKKVKGYTSSHPLLTGIQP